MENSKISWTNHTANLWWGCEKVHTGCKNCYAETLDNRYNHENPHWGPGSSRKIVLSVWKDLARFQRDAAKEGVVHRVFVGSMMDIFEDPRPVVDQKNESVPMVTGGTLGMHTGDLRSRLFSEISEGKYPNLMFLLLTKRPENINIYIPELWKETPPENVMFGTSVVNQETADTMVYPLCKVKGKRFLSCEPMVGPIDLTNMHMGHDFSRVNALSGKLNDFTDAWQMETIHWVIVGGESGHKSRAMNPDWARSLRDQCQAANVPFHFKQLSENEEFLPGVNFKDFDNYPKDLQIRKLPIYEC